MIDEIKSSDRRYYCSLSNFHVNDGLVAFNTWEDFKEAWLQYDSDYNHLFRFDIEPKYDEEDNITDEYELRLFYMLQRKGNFVPVRIERITKDDLKEINELLQDSWYYIQEMWSEFSGVKEGYR